MEDENPFSPAYPVNPKYFLDREEILNSFRKVVNRSRRSENPTPDNFILFGDWGLGKTSVLRKFESIISQEFRGKRNIFFATIELTPHSSKNFPLFLSKVMDDITGNFSIIENNILGSVVENYNLFKKIRNEIREWKLKYNGNEVKLKKKIRERSPSNYFKEVLGALWNLLEKNFPEIDAGILMIDDLHYLTERNPESIYELYSTFQSLPREGCNFILCTSGERALLSEINNHITLNEPINRFFNISHTLKPFSLTETSNMILEPIRHFKIPLEIEPEVIEKIHSLTLGHPFFIQFTMRELLTFSREDERRKISLDYFYLNHHKIMSLLENEKFQRDFSLASDKERKILLEMSTLGKKFSPSEIKIENSRIHLRFLLKKNLIIKHDRGRYSLYHPLFREYLKGVKERKR